MKSLILLLALFSSQVFAQDCTHAELEKHFSKLENINEIYFATDNLAELARNSDKALLETHSYCQKNIKPKMKCFKSLVNRLNNTMAHLSYDGMKNQCEGTAEIVKEYEVSR